MRLAFRNLTRHYRKSILSAAIGILTVLLLVIYAGNIDSTRRQLTALPNAMEIRGAVSNLNGSQDFSLSISEERVEGIAACPEVEDQVFTVQLMAGFGEFTLEEWKENLHYFGRESMISRACLGCRAGKSAMQSSGTKAFLPGRSLSAF